MIETRSIYSKIGYQILLTLLILPFALPLFQMVTGSFAGMGWRNYQAVLAVPGIANYFRSSLIIAGGTITIVVLFSLASGFGFSKMKIAFKEVYFWGILAALTIPEVVLLTPLFVTTLRYGLYDTYWAVILPLAALQLPFAILITRNYINAIPNELFDSAKIDGARMTQAFRHIVIPLSRPIGATVVVLSLLSAWNSYLLPLVFLQNPERQTVTLLPLYFISQFGNDQTKVLASAIVIAIPEVLAYLVLQKFFERGLSAGAVK